jgi:hypothetical protein
VYFSLFSNGYVQQSPPPADPNIPPIGSGSISTAMSVSSGTIRASLVEGTAAELPELVVLAFSEPLNRLIQVVLPIDPASGLQGSFKVAQNGRYLDQTHLGLTTRLDPAYTPVGTYRGSATLYACEGWYATTTGMLFCGQMYSNASGSVPYEIVIRGITTTITPLSHPSYRGNPVASLRTDVPINTSYLVKAYPSAPFLGASLTRDFHGGYELNVTVPPGTPRGIVTGNVLVRVCRDAPDTCADPHQGSPFNVTVSYDVP